MSENIQPTGMLKPCSHVGSSPKFVDTKNNNVSFFSPADTFQNRVQQSFQPSETRPLPESRRQSKTVSRDFFIDCQTERIPEIKIPSKVFRKQLSNSFSHKQGELKKWVHELYTKERNVPPVGTHHYTERLTCPQKAMQTKINRDA